MMSPLPARSTLMTSAPMSASRCVPKGPAAACSKARTRMPLSADSGIGPGLREGADVRRICPLPHHHASAVLHDDGSILLDPARSELHDAPLRARLRFPGLQHLALGVERVAFKEGIGKLDLIPPQ